MKYIALLRGIGPGNPNMHNNKLRGVFESLGYTNVQSVIASGNILFETKNSDEIKLESDIEKALSSSLGIPGKTIVRSQADLQKLVDSDPFKGLTDARTSMFNVTFLKSKPNTKVDLPYKVPGYTVMDNLGREITSIIDVTNAKTPDMMRWLEKTYSKDITTRTWKTVNRILKKLGS